MTVAPTTEAVAIAWLQTLPGLPVNQIGRTLPQDNSTWAASGFVKVIAVGGQSGMYFNKSTPLVQIDCFAVNPTSGKPPWGKANALAEAVRQGTYLPVPETLTLPAIYTPARLLSVWVSREPTQVAADEGSHAHYSLDLNLVWTS